VFVGRASSLDRSSPDMAPPPAKRQQFNHGARPIPADRQRAGRGQVVDGSWPPPTTTADQLLPTKSTQTEITDPSTLAESLSMLMDDPSGLNAEERRRLQEILRFSGCRVYPFYVKIMYTC